MTGMLEANRKPEAAVSASRASSASAFGHSTPRRDSARMTERQGRQQVTVPMIVGMRVLAGRRTATTAEVVLAGPTQTGRA